MFKFCLIFHVAQVIFYINSWSFHPLLLEWHLFFSASNKLGSSKRDEILLAVVSVNTLYKVHEQVIGEQFFVVSQSGMCLDSSIIVLKVSII
jgi:hypothetical protein